MALTKTDGVFKALADRTRRRVMQLVSNNELSVTELVECLGMPQSTVSRHLKVLREAELIVDRREGATVLYMLGRRSESGQGGANNSGNGGAAGGGRPLEVRILDWVREEPLDPRMKGRLRNVLAQRRERSTEFFARIGHRWDHLRRDAFGSTFHLEALVRLCPADWAVADIGTGTGYLLPVLARAFRQVTAIDPVLNMLDVSRQRCESEKLDNVSFQQGDLAFLPLGDDSVDLALAFLVLHHVDSPDEALVEIRRIVRPGGRVLIVEQVEHRLGEFHDRMQDRWWGFDKNELAAKLVSTGFSHVDVCHLPTEPAGMISPELFTLTASA